MKVENVRIYDLEESLIASGYPMRTMATQDRDLDEKDIKLVIRVMAHTDSL